jgi:hypothetical protein
MLSLASLREGWRMFIRSRYAKRHGFKAYQGDDWEICLRIINDCWNGRYFQVSTGNFNEFWTRDFGWCCNSLLKLGYKNEVKITLEYVLNTFFRAGRTTSAISSYGKVFDFPTYSPDTLAFLLRSLREAKAHSLVEKYRPLLIKEANRFYKTAIDEDTGLVRKDRIFSSMKDYASRRCSCHDNVMANMLKDDLKFFGLENPLEDYDLKGFLLEKFWNGSYFLDNIDSYYVSGDANVLPFWTGVIKSRSMMKSAIAAIQEDGLDYPFPLKYTKNIPVMNWLGILTPDYQGDSIWTHLGPMFISLVQKTDRKKADEYLAEYKKMVDHFKTYPEVFTKESEPYSSPFYYSDEGMLWCAMYLALKK